MAGFYFIAIIIFLDYYRFEINCLPRAIDGAVCKEESPFTLLCFSPGVLMEIIIGHEGLPVTFKLEDESVLSVSLGGNIQEAIFIGSIGPDLLQVILPGCIIVII